MQWHCCVFGRRIKSLVFSTDVAIIKNINTDAVIAVYPFTPQPKISGAIIDVSDVPVFVGVGGGITSGIRSLQLAIEAEHQGAFGVVVNAPIPGDVITEIKKHVDIPVIATGGPSDDTIRATIEAGANAITYTPPTNGELFALTMQKYRTLLNENQIKDKQLNMSCPLRD